MQSKTTTPLTARLDRRAFLSSAAIGMTVPALAATPSPEAQSTEIQCKPSGEFGRRVRLAADRLSKGNSPAFTDEFILADVALTPERRFNEFSGDLSGRFIEAVTVLPIGADTGQLDRLVRAALSFQRTDGRFGDPKLAFTPDSIGAPHMALLWGNGRLLVGLAEAHRRLQSNEILESARRLAGFILKVRQDCSDPAVLKRLEGLGANGSICFTQTVEGLVELSRLTGDRSYLDAGASILPLLGPRAIQHSHGYLTTLRGGLKLYEETHDPAHLAFVEQAYQDLLNSSDYSIYGSVTEYFGWNPSSKKTVDLATLITNSGGDPRDEGCSHADFLRLSLQLWNITRRPEFLDRAERCLWNGLYPNQYPTGDFGSHAYFSLGIKPVANVGRAWWCCTMHGYRAFKDVLTSAVTSTSDDAMQVNLLEELQGSGKHGQFRTSWGPASQHGLSFRVPYVFRWTAATDRQLALSIRQPAWASQASIVLNGSEIKAADQEGRWEIARRWHTGDDLQLILTLEPRLLARDGNPVDWTKLGAEPVEAAMFVGPWLMGISSVQEPFYFGEPWENNTLQLGTGLALSSSKRTILEIPYIHGGFPGSQRVGLRRLCEASLEENAIWSVWHRWRRS